MARIRSIKPEFFTSETIAALPLSARLTFIGLWTYVDDNGVGLDNERLIIASVWPLEDDLPATILRTRDDLRTLSRAALVIRYPDGARRLIHIRTWEEHQKVSHPRKPRYPLPADGLTSEHEPPEALGRHSRGFPEPLRPEQGAGSREQGGVGAPPLTTPDTLNGAAEPGPSALSQRQNPPHGNLAQTPGENPARTETQNHSTSTLLNSRTGHQP